MRNFFQFIWNNQFTFLFFLLEFIGFVLLTTNNSFHNNALYSTSIALSGKIASVNNSYTQYIGLKEENNLLLKESARLKEKLLNSPALPANDNSRICYKTMTANAIKSTYNLGNNYIILNKGSNSGIAPQQGVIGPEGVVGIISHCSEHYSKVIPLIHSQSLISCKLASSSYFGILKWEGKDDEYAILEDIPNHVRIQPNDTVLTRGSSGAFPPNELVGFAVSSEKNESSGFQSITVKLATNYKNIDNLYVIENAEKPELDSLLIEIEP